MISPLLAVAAMAGAILGFLLGWIMRKSATTGTEEDPARLRRSYQELSQEMARTLEELSRKREIAISIPMIVRSLSGKLPISAIPAIAVRFTKDFFHASQVGFFAPAKGENRFTLIEGVGFPPDWKGNLRIVPEEGILGMAIENKMVATRDEFLTGRIQQATGPDSLEKKGVTADLVAPVIVNSKVVGVLVIVSDTLRINNEIPLVSMIADLLSNAFQQATTIESVEQSAAIDPLTKVYTRGYFAQRFEAEIRRAKNYTQPLTLLLFDIDHFKKVNDTYGHPAGDRILVRLGQILSQNIRSSDFVARYGGEEFVVVMTAADKEQAYIFADNLRIKVEGTLFPIPGQDLPLRLTISGGLATFPEHGASTTELIRTADEALYEAKQAGRNRIVRAQQLGLDGMPL
ncbi:MAG TPA: sensor domain-containing diguanylate cyclase [Candidatus Deferrimicrobiaceae bacterium]|nr:sensor domain-containing diguanylate cyclase [Candidatus Deferrimicrobiaceae bacterium]